MSNDMTPMEKLLTQISLTKLSSLKVQAEIEKSDPDKDVIKAEVTKIAMYANNASLLITEI